MNKIVRWVISLTFLELSTVWVYLAVSLHLPGDSAGLGYTTPRLIFLIFFLLLTLLLGVLNVRAVAAIKITQWILGALTGDAAKNKWLALSSLTAVAVVGIILSTAKIAAGYQFIDRRLDILIILATVVCLQLLILLARFFNISAAVGLEDSLSRTLDAFKEFDSVLFISSGSLRQYPVSKKILLVVFYGIILALVPVLVYLRLFMGPLETAVEFRYGFTQPVLFLFFGYFIVSSLRGSLGSVMGLTLALVVFGLPLVGLWSSGYNESNILRGLIPWSDANGYYMDANRLLDGGLFTGNSSRRPLFAGFLSVLLGVTGRNLQTSLILITGMAAVASYLTAREVQRTHGALPGTVLLVILFLFYRTYTGTTLTENLGVTFGILGFAFLWRGANARDWRFILSGIFLTTLGLNVRSGAYLVLPALVIWVARIFREHRWFSIKFLGLGVTVILLGFGMNTLVFRTVGGPDSAPDSNFSNVLYGLANGGQTWDYVYDVHPEIRPLSEPEHSQRIYALAWDTFRTNPSGAVTGALKAWSYFFDFHQGVYNFIRSGFFEENYYIVRWVVIWLAILGIIEWFFRRHQAYTTLTLTGFGAVVLSVPFVPLWDAAYMRLYAATIPFIAALPVLGAILLGRLFTRLNRQLNFLSAPLNVLPGLFIEIISVSLVLVTIVGPVIIRLSAQRQALRVVTCPAGFESATVRASYGSYLHIWDGDLLPQTWIPDIRRSNFVEGNTYDFPYRQTLEEIRSIEGGSLLLLNTYDLSSNQEIKMFIKDSLLPVKSGKIAVCGKWGETKEFFYVNSIEVLP